MSNNLALLSQNGAFFQIEAPMLDSILAGTNPRQRMKTGLSPSIYLIECGILIPCRFEQG